MSWNTFKKLVVDAYVREYLIDTQQILKEVQGVDFTQTEVAAEFEVTTNRISFLERSALQKLRHPKRSRFLAPFLEPEPADHGGKRVNTTSYPRRARLRHNSTTSLLDW